jgi:succinate dehydrogenase/fumarate reductase cytochrome b subunit
MKKLFAIAAILTGLKTFAQEANNVEMADAMRSNGKIYVVVAVLVVIFLGMIIYLINLDRKISKLEKETKK